MAGCDGRKEEGRERFAPGPRGVAARTRGGGTPHRRPPTDPACEQRPASAPRKTYCQRGRPEVVTSTTLRVDRWGRGRAPSGREARLGEGEAMARARGRRGSNGDLHRVRALLLGHRRVSSASSRMPMACFPEGVLRGKRDERGSAGGFRRRRREERDGEMANGEWRNGECDGEWRWCPRPIGKRAANPKADH